MLVPRCHFDAEGHRRATREAIVLVEIDRFVWQLLHVKCPEEAGNSEEYLLLSKRDTRADATTVIGWCKFMCQDKIVVTYPAPNIQWSRCVGSARLADSALE